MGTSGAPFCKICQSPTVDAGRKYGRFSDRWYHLRRCDSCAFSFVADPWTDYPTIYSDKYYAGRGADGSVDYLFELERPGETIRSLEWRGIVRAVNAIGKLDRNARWLDFGCGNGGLVRYCRDRGYPNIVGFEDGAIRDRAAEAGVPFATSEDLDRSAGAFDVVTAIEVLEHVEDPLSVLRRVRRLLKPGGLLFLTTGNARRHRADLPAWSYVLPEVHISFFEPRTLSLALSKAGFQPVFPGYVDGFNDILRFKILKGLGVRTNRMAHRLVPWAVLGRLVDRFYGVSEQPAGIAAPLP